MRQLINEPCLTDILHPCAHQGNELPEEKKAIVPMTQRAKHGKRGQPPHNGTHHPHSNYCTRILSISIFVFVARMTWMSIGPILTSSFSDGIRPRACMTKPAIV